jgi:peptidoglycan/xylan/chitin deacetylase (PgdA/CDA1 family)
MKERLKARLRIPFSGLLDVLSRWSARRVGLALVYHRVGDPQEESAGHLLPALGTALFEAQLRHLTRRYRVVPPSRLLEAIEARRRGEPLPVSVTFDDDLASHVRTAMPILRRVGVPAAFFLSGASLSAPFAFWWERLQLAFDSGVLEEEAVSPWIGSSAKRSGGTDIHTVAQAIEAMPPDRREVVARELLDRLGSDPPDAGLRVADVRALAREGFEIGFHTMRHDALPSLDDEALKRAMGDGRPELAEHVGRELSMIAYPHGLADARVAAAAREVGYRFGFTTEPETVGDDTDALLIGRLYPAYESAGHFAMQVSRTLRRQPAA